MFILWILRFFVFTLYESPKYLMGRGRDEDAVSVIHKVAEYNGKTSSLKIEHLRAADEQFKPEKGIVQDDKAILDTSARAAVLRKLRGFDANHVKALFATKKLAWSTSLLITLWGKSDMKLHQTCTNVKCSINWTCIPIVRIMTKTK